MYLLLITQSYNILCSITNRFLTLSLKIMTLAAILKIFTNITNIFLDYQYVSGYFQMRFYTLYLKLYAKFTVSVSAILDSKMGPNGENPWWFLIVLKLAY